MHAIVSLLEAPAYSRIEAIWRVLEVNCGLKGIKATPYPHFSWHVANRYDLSALGITLQQIAARSEPFVIRTAGLGLFTGQDPIIYVVIVKNDALIRFHERVWQKVDECAEGPNPLYAPSAWVPHVTLAHGDVTREKLACAVEELAYYPLDWEVKIDNISMVYQTGDEVGDLKYRYRFQLTG